MPGICFFCYTIQAEVIEGDCFADLDDDGTHEKLVKRLHDPIELVVKFEECRAILLSRIINHSRLYALCKEEHQTSRRS